MTRWAPPEVVTAAAGGDAAAVEQLVTMIWPACFRLAASLIGDTALAQDAAQEACVIVHRKIAGLRDAGAFDTWLYRIVARESSRVRRQHTDVPLSYEEGFVRDTATSLDVWRALATLSPHLREVTVLFYFDDLKTEEIASILRVPHPTVRTRLMRAREHLRHTLGDYEIHPQTPHGEVPQHAC